MVQSEAYLITYQEYCCLEGVGAGRKPCSKYVHSHQYCYNSAQYLTNALFTLGWFRQIQGSVVHRCCSSFAWHTIKKKTTNYFKNKGNRKVCLLQQQTSMEASGETEGKTSE